MLLMSSEYMRHPRLVCRLAADKHHIICDKYLAGHFLPMINYLYYGQYEQFHIMATGRYGNYICRMAYDVTKGQHIVSRHIKVHNSYLLQFYTAGANTFDGKGMLYSPYKPIINSKI